MLKPILDVVNNDHIAEFQVMWSTLESMIGDELITDIPFDGNNKVTTIRLPNGRVVLHSEDDETPAVTFKKTGTKVWCQYGLISRAGKPAVIFANDVGSMHFHMGMLHNVNGAAVVIGKKDSPTAKLCFRNHKLHDDINKKPAVKINELEMHYNNGLLHGTTHHDGVDYHYQYGKLHNKGAPAVKYRSTSYDDLRYINGIRVKRNY